MKRFLFLSMIVCVILAAGCDVDNTQETNLAPTESPTPGITETIEVIETLEPPSLSITLGDPVVENGIRLNGGGDVDALAVVTNDLPAHQTGNGTALTSGDGNDVPDGYIQFNVDDDAIFGGSPVGRVRVEVDYLDQGKDSFIMQYDAKPTSFSEGLFAGGGGIVKTDSGEIKTAVFTLCDAYFANRVNGGDFRLSDNFDGAEIFTEVRVIGVPSLIQTFMVDNYGANPLDDLPDSEAIQSMLDTTCSGDTVVFTSGRNTDGYKGYLIDKTIFLTGMSAKHDLTFTSSDTENHALLKATADLKGFVVHLFSRSRVSPYKNIYNIDFGYIDIDGGRDVRACMGADGIGNGEGDNWGSWLPECNLFDDPWCSPGNMSFYDFYGNVVVHDLINAQTECGTALGFWGDNGTIRNLTIDIAGDHVHNTSCEFTDADMDGYFGGWADGITMGGDGLTIIDNEIINPSDIGIVHFGGVDALIANNVIKITAGNYGAFGGIALHPWNQADFSGVQMVGNTIISEADTICGGLHLGINIGGHLWNWGCEEHPQPGTVGNPGCTAEPDPNEAVPCGSDTCQVWLVVPEGSTLTMKDNSVTGSQVNYFIEGMIINGTFLDENNISMTPRQTDWREADIGCYGIPWGPLDKAAHHPSLPGYVDLIFHCY